MSKNFKICDREIGENHPPLVIAEIGINHNGDFKKAKQMISDAHNSGAECVKFQCHIIEDEMIPNQIIPANATESIWEIMKKCSFSKENENELLPFVTLKDIKAGEELFWDYRTSGGDNLEKQYPFLN